MQAVVLEAFGGPENLRPRVVPDPTPGPGEVLLKVHACGVCFHDVINRRGNLPRTSVPAILGHEAAGEVIEVGEGVEDWSIGDRAATLQRMSCGHCHHCHDDRPSLCKKDHRFFGEELQGGYADYMPAPVAGIGRVPSSVDWPVAATACCTAGTAVHVLRTRARVRSGETVVVTGASGGVGLAGHPTGPPRRRPRAGGHLERRQGRRPERSRRRGSRRRSGSEILADRCASSPAKAPTR